MAQILAIDIGSTQIKTFTAQITGEDLQITGVGLARSSGIKKGTIVNMDLASKAIKQSIEEAKQQCGVVIPRAIISISSAHAKSVDSHGIVNIPTKEITEQEVNRAMRTALYNASVPSDYEVLHALPFNFKVDEQDLIQDPVGMSGSRLVVSVHIIIAQKSTIENLKRTVEAAGVGIENIVLSGYASSIAVINDDAKELGVCVVDMGGGMCDIVVHQGNSIRYSEYVGIGGSHVTGDLSIALHTPLDIAEKLKLQSQKLNSDNKTIEIPVTGNKEEEHQEVESELISNIIYARLQETLAMLNQKLEKSGFKKTLGAGIILTGGATKISAIKDVAIPIFDNMPIRIAKPHTLDGMFETLKGDQAFSTVLGLVRYAAGQYTLYEIDSNKSLKTRFDSSNSNTQIQEDHDGGLIDISSIKEKVHKEKSSISDVGLAHGKSKNPIVEFFAKMWRNATQLF